MCQLFKITNMIMIWTVLHNTTGEYVAQWSFDSTDRCPPTHNLAFHITMSPSRFRFRFMDRTMGITCFPTGIDLSGTIFQCLRSMWSRDSLFVSLINSWHSGCCRASLNFIVLVSEETAIEIAGLTANAKMCGSAKQLPFWRRATDLSDLSGKKVWRNA